VRIKLRRPFTLGRLPREYLKIGSEWDVVSVTDRHPDLPGLEYLVIQDHTGRNLGVRPDECDVLDAPEPVEVSQ
jgi:hypothetical protein